MKIRMELSAIILGGVLFGISHTALAYTGACTNTAGQNYYIADIGSASISDEQNVPGVIVDPLISWGAQAKYTVQCDCDESIRQTDGIWAFSSDMLIPAEGDGWYSVNDAISVKVRVNITGSASTHSEIPFSNIATNAQIGGASMCDAPQTYSGDVTGSKGDIALKLKKPLTGHYRVSGLNIAGLWMCYNTPASSVCNTSGQPNVIYDMSMDITTPENCTINAGNELSIDLGTIFSGNFKGAQKKPVGYTAKKISVPVKCASGIDTEATLSFRIDATSAEDYPSAIKTTNAGVGILLEDNSGTVIEPNTTHMPVNLINSQGTIDINVWPVSTTGNFSDQGAFTAVATLVVEID